MSASSIAKSGLLVCPSVLNNHDGKGDDIALAQEAIETIDREATSEGLTKKIEKLLEK